MNDIATTTKTPSDAALLFLVFGAARELEGRLEAALGEIGLSMAKASVLKALAHSGGSMTLGDVAERHNCVRSNVTQLIDRLEEEGFVTRHNDPDDRRVRRASLTPEGHKVYREATRVVTKQGRALLQSLTAAEVELLTEVLRKLGG